MLNEQYILRLINPYLNSKRELSEFEFFELFSELERKEQYDIINIMIKNNIDYVDEKEEEKKELENVPILRSKNDGKDYRKMMQLTNEQLCVMHQRGDTAALAALMEKNKRFVYQMALKIAKEYRQQSLTVEDLFMEGNLGLIEAANKFDVSMGYMFTTYAWHWIRQKIVRAAIDTGYLVRIPVHLFDKLIKINNCRKRHDELTFPDLLEYLRTEENMELTADKLDELIAYSEIYMNTSSLNDVVGEDGDTERIDFIPDDSISVEDLVMEEHFKEDIRAVLATLKPRERQVIEMRFGLDDGHEKTLEEIGTIFGVTRERIRQIELKALRKLRHPSKIKKLKEYQ